MMHGYSEPKQTFQEKKKFIAKKFSPVHEVHTTSHRTLLALKIT